VTQLLVVDDDEALCHWQERVVREQGYSCDSAHSAKAARDRLRARAYELVLLDVNMPGESGMRLLVHIRRDYPEVAVLMVTGEDSAKLAMIAIENGAYGYLVKPVASGELLINVANALHRRRYELSNRRLIERLQATVQERGRELVDALHDLQLAESDLRVSQAETIFRLARMVEFRDEETGHHVRRMSCYCQILARQIGFSEERCELIRLSSQLHDVGKVAVPDSVLLKRGKLTAAEFDIIKGHAQTGYNMLADSRAEVVRLGGLIARTHHERWDGSGYPRGLAGKDIPPEGRIAAIADVFDALTSDRVYRSALPVERTLTMMQEERGRHFDPEMLDCFLEVQPEIEAIRHAYAD
jgi:putative two-component system response regulator